MSRSFRRVAAAAAVVLAAGVLPAVSVSTAGAAPDRSPFKPGSSFDSSADRARITPTEFNAVQVDLAQVRSALSHAPRSGAARGSSLVFSVPTPTGSSERFAVQRTSVMESELAAAHPEIATYSGRSLDHRGTTIALDTTPMGFHAAVRGPSGQGAYYVDPAYDARGTTLHLSYYGSAVDRTATDTFAEREAPEVKRAVAERTEQARSSSRTQPGDAVKQRFYRLALTSDPSYADYFGSENVLAEKVTLMNRVNQIYNDDLAINMRLVNATDKLNLDTDAKATGANGPCGAHPCFDPADPNDANSFSQLDFCDVPTLGRNRTVLGQLVGASNYDIGHIALGVNGGGIAYLGVVGADYKGGGCTGLPQPKGDFYAIDYVAHEMGHQFAGNHTFDGVQNACSGGNRNGATSVEPGSGSSVMAYAGICLQDDLQPHTDPYFGQRSITEIGGYTSNLAPSVIEVQTVSLRGFDTNGEKIQINFPGSTGPVTLTRGSTYNRGGITAAVEKVTGQNVTIAGWGYDPFGSYTVYPAPITEPDDSGFQVIFAPTAKPDAPGTHSDQPSLGLSSPSAGVSGFVGETAKGGAPANRGDQILTTDNHNPKVKAPGTRTIPTRTPFVLTGGGFDKDGDKLSYLWEQNDTGDKNGTALVSQNKKSGPLFRIFGRYANVSDKGTLMTPSPGENRATGHRQRYFPDKAQVLRGNTNARTGTCPSVKPLPSNLDNYQPVGRRALDCYSEFLPIKGYVGTFGSKTPAMHFRLTARDGYPTGGGTAYDDVKLTIDQNAGPFLVTSQASKKTSVRGGNTRKITWKVNGTQRLASQVRILLSLNGGKNFSTVLSKATANDGSQVVQIPKGRTQKARIMLQAKGNYFYSVNAAPFTIK